MAAPAFNIPSQGFSSGEAVGATLTNIQPVGDGQLGFVFPGSSVVIPNVNLVAAGTYRYSAALLPLHVQLYSMLDTLTTAWCIGH